MGKKAHRIFGGLLLGLLWSGAVHAQSPQILLRAPLHTSAPASLSFSRILPNHALQNPSGYSYLCNLELDIERQLPVGLWLKMDERPAFNGNTAQWAYFRLKFPLK